MLSWREDSSFFWRSFRSHATQYVESPYYSGTSLASPGTIEGVQISEIFGLVKCILSIGYTPRARLLSDLATECRRHGVAKSLGNQA